MFLIKTLNLLSKYALYHLLSKIHECVGHYELYSCLNVVLDCLNICLIVSNKMHVEEYTIRTNFDVL